MLRVPKLDDLSYDKLVQRARSQIHMHTDEWTDFNDHDPGITTLQTMAWLVDMLNYYIDATGEEHRLGYLGLLGLYPEAEAASCYVAVSGEGNGIRLAGGAKLLAGETVFELAEGYEGTPNRMTALLCETDGAFTDLTPFAGVDGEFASVFTLDRETESTLYIGFERALADTARLYFDVMKNPRRVPFDDEFFLSELLWEYNDGGRWRSVGSVADGTCGFLRGGFVTLAIPGGTKPVQGHSVLPEGHYLRVRLVRNSYDALPRLGEVYQGCVAAVQTNTYAQALEYVYNGECEIPIDYHVNKDDVVCVAVEEEDGYSLWFEYMADSDSLCEVADGEYPWQRVVRFDSGKFGALPELGQKILVTVTGAGFYDKMRLGLTCGFAWERMELDVENLYELRLALVEEKNGRPFYRLWSACDNLREAPCDARVFRYDRAAGEIVFGDGITGVQPKAKQLVLAVTLKTSLLGDGNVRAGQINRLADTAYEGIAVRNPEDAAGGKSSKTSAELEDEIESKVYETSRAVTQGDYRKLVSGTPGLMIDGVSVISGREYARFYKNARPQDAVLLAVKPYSGHQKRPVLSAEYTRRIREHIERYRLVTINVLILPAKYVGIEVEGAIVLTENTPANRERVAVKLHELADALDSVEFGKSIVYGIVFSHLEMLDCVEKVTGLSFTPMGESAQKNEQGDVIVYPDALAYLGRIDIEYTQREG